MKRLLGYVETIQLILEVTDKKHYSGYFGRIKCSQKGVWHGRRIFQELHNVQHRMDTSFRNQTQAGHYHGVLLFYNLTIDRVKTFLVDNMNGACLGIMGRSLLLLGRGPRAVKMPAGQTEEISRWVSDLNRGSYMSDIVFVLFDLILYVPSTIFQL